jgi:hypothetical protein
MKIIHNRAFCNDYYTAFPAVFYQQAETHTTNFEAHAVFVFLVKGDFSGRVSKRGKNLIFFFIQTKLLLTKHQVFSWFLMSSGIKTTSQFFLCSLTFTSSNKGPRKALWTVIFGDHIQLQAFFLRHFGPLLPNHTLCIQVVYVI